MIDLHSSDSSCVLRSRNYNNIVPNLTSGSHSALAREIESLDVASIKLRRASIVEFLHHKSYLVRIAAAEALGAAAIECSQITTALATERNDLVLSYLCGAVADAGCAAGLAVLEDLATRHPSSLARSSAAVAIADLQGDKAGEFLRARVKVETSARARATLIALLVQSGDRDALKGFHRCLRSKDYMVRIRLADLLGGTNKGPFKTEILAAFRDALLVETSVAAREALERAVAAA